MTDTKMDPQRGMFEPLFGRVLVLTGPTASGKTKLALEVAQRLTKRRGTDQPAAEIISLDSIAVYRGMDIGTAKPTSDERAAVPHHLIDVVDPNEPFSVAEYLKLAHETTSRILGRGRHVLFVGGTPMFLKAILRGFDPGPPADSAFRQSVEADVAAYGIEPLRKRLWQVDPLSALRIEPNDVRRTIRALEFSHLTGRPISHHQTQFDRAHRAEDGLVFGLQVPRETLHRRIEHRVEAMFNAGLAAEVQALLQRYGTLSRTAAQAVGYRELIEAIVSNRDPDEMLGQVQINTRQLAKRQETWFRSFREIRPLATMDGGQNVPVSELADKIIQTIDEVHEHAQF